MSGSRVTSKTTLIWQKPIAVGEIVGDDYVVRSGLKTGEQIIVSNLQKIGDGAPVRPVPADAPAPQAAS